MHAEHKDTNWPEAQLHMLFSQEFILGRKGLGKGKIKSLFYENGKKKVGLDQIQTWHLVRRRPVIVMQWVKEWI